MHEDRVPVTAPKGKSIPWAEFERKGRRVEARVLTPPCGTKQ